MHHQHVVQYSSGEPVALDTQHSLQHHPHHHHHAQSHQHDNKSISWCKKRTLYQSGGLRGSFGCSPQEFSSPSYFEGLEEEGAGPHSLEDEEDLNTVLQSYLESTSFSDGQSSSSPSQQSTDSGFAGDAGYSTPSSSNISYCNNPSAQQQQQQQTGGSSYEAAYYYHQHQHGANNGSAMGQFYPGEEYSLLSGSSGGFLADGSSQHNSFGGHSGSGAYEQHQYVPPPPPIHAEDDFHSSEDLSVIVDQVLNSIDEAQFDTSNYAPSSVEYSGLLPEASPGGGLQSSCDHCGNPILGGSSSKECKNCELNQLNGQQPSEPVAMPIQSTPPSETKSNEGSFGASRKSPKTVAAVQPMQRSIGVVEPRVVVKIPINKIQRRQSLSEELEEESEESSVNPNGGDCHLEEEDEEGVLKERAIHKEPVIEDEDAAMVVPPPRLEIVPSMEVEEAVDQIQQQEEENKEEEVINSHKDVSFSKDLMEEVVKDFEDEDFPESLQLGGRKSSSSSHHHHKKKKHKRKKKKVCKCGGSKKRKRCESPPPTLTMQSSQEQESLPDALEASLPRGGKQVNPLKIVRISNSESEEFKIEQGDDDRTTLEAPVLERQVYASPVLSSSVDSFGRVNGSALLSFRDLALKAAAAEEGDNVMYSNEEDEDGSQDDSGTPEEPPPPSLTPPPPTLHRHDSPEPCDKEMKNPLQPTPEACKEELVDLLADLPSVVLPPRELKEEERKKAPAAAPIVKIEVSPKIKKEEDSCVEKPKTNVKESSGVKTKMLLEKDPEDEWLYCQTKHCHFWTRKVKRMERHKRTHAGTEEDMYYVCPDCFAKFYSLAKMLKHDRKFHTGEKDYECKICEAEVTDIHVHMRVHRADKEFRCSTCPLTFRHKNSLVRHVFQHSGERPYKCQTCNSGFFSLSKLKEHVRRRHSVQSEPLPPTPQQHQTLQMPIKTEGLLRQYPKLAPRLNNPGDDDVVIVGLKPAPNQQQPTANTQAVHQARSLALPAGAAGNSRTILAPSSIILPPQPAPQGVLSYLAQGPNGSVYLVTNPAPGANIFLGQSGEGILMPQQPLFIPQSPVLIPQQSTGPHGATPLIQSNSNSTLFVVPAAPVLNVPPQAPQKAQPEKKLDILQQAILEIPDHFQSFEEE